MEQNKRDLPGELGKDTVDRKKGGGRKSRASDPKKPRLLKLQRKDLLRAEGEGKKIPTKKKHGNTNATVRGLKGVWGQKERVDRGEKRKNAGGGGNCCKEEVPNEKNKKPKKKSMFEKSINAGKRR